MQSATDSMSALIARLYPICRSITGNGVRESLAILREKIPLEMQEVPTGEKVFDWIIPREWNIRDAYIKNAAGERLVDFQKLNLHVVSYSTPIHRQMRLAELRDHLFTLPDQPNWVPYRTSYYRESWGFCLSEQQLKRFNDTETYDVCIDSTLEDGHLTFGEYFLAGDRSEELAVANPIQWISSFFAAVWFIPGIRNYNLLGVRRVFQDVIRHICFSFYDFVDFFFY